MNITNGEIHYDDDAHYLSSDGKAFYLDHSCDQWVIGSIEDAKKFLADLQKTITAVEAGSVRAKPSPIKVEESSK